MKRIALSLLSGLSLCVSSASAQVPESVLRNEQTFQNEKRLSYGKYEHERQFLWTFLTDAMSAPPTIENAIKYNWYLIDEEFYKQKGLFWSGAPWFSRYQRYLIAFDQRVAPKIAEDVERLFEKKTGIDQLGNSLQEACALLNRPGRNWPDALYSQKLALSQCLNSAAPKAMVRLTRAEGTQQNVSLDYIRMNWPLRSLPQSLKSYPQGTQIMAVSGYVEELAPNLSRNNDEIAAEVSRKLAKIPDDQPLQPPASYCSDILGSGLAAMANESLDRKVYLSFLGTDVFGVGKPETVKRIYDFARAVSVPCKTGASAKVMKRQEATLKAVSSAFDAIRIETSPLQPVATMCQTALRGQLAPNVSLTAFPAEFSAPIQKLCEKRGRDIQEKIASYKLATALALIKNVPKSLVSLQSNNYFIADDARLGIASAGQNESDDGYRQAVARIRNGYDQAANEARQEALNNALSDIRQRYNAGLTDTELAPARALCQPIVNKGWADARTIQGQIDQALVNSCKQSEASVAPRRCDAAIRKADPKGIFAKSDDRTMIAVPAPDGTLAMTSRGEIVCGAVQNGLEVTFDRSGWLFKTTTLSITPKGKSNPVLKAELEDMSRPDGVSILKIKKMDSLPGLDGPLSTISCIVTSMKDAQEMAGWSALGTAAAVWFDMPKTADRLATNTIQAATIAAACQGAMRAFGAVQ